MSRHDRRRAAKVAPAAPPAATTPEEQVGGELAARLVVAYLRATAANEKFQAAMQQFAVAATENGKFTVTGIRIDDKTDGVFVQRVPAPPT